MGPNLQLVKVNPLTVSAETISELETLLAEAKAGQITGLAYVALHRGAEFSVCARGRARFIPTHTLGALESLRQFVAKMI